MTSIALQPIPEHPALFIPTLQMIVISDLHIGIEHELQEHGVHASDLTPMMIKEIIALCAQYHPTDLLILGDLKHSIPATPYIEQRKVKSLLTTLQEYVQVHIVPGNHDGFLKRFIPPGISIYSSSGVTIENYAFVHGHRWPNPSHLKTDHLIMAHSHPTVALKDRLQYTTYEPCWIKAKPIPKKIIERYPDYNPNITFLFIPAFNPISGGLAVNEEGIMGPLSKITNIDLADIYLLDGTFLGKVQDICD